MTVKVTKKEKEFYENFAASLIANTVLARVSAGGTEITDEVALSVQVVIANSDISTVIEAVTQGFKELNISLKDLLRVQKFLSTNNNALVINAAQVVSADVQEQVNTVIAEIVEQQTPAESSDVVLEGEIV